MNLRLWIALLLLATSPTLADPKDWKPGDRFRDGQRTYELVKRLGKGSFVQAWEAKTDSGENVALRIYDKEPPRAFYMNLNAVSQIHAETPESHLLRVYPIVEEVLPGGDRVHFHVAELAQHDLESVMDRDFRLSPTAIDGSERVGQIHALMLDLVHGADQLHQAKLVHGDIKPENILRLRDRYVLADFDAIASPLMIGVGCTGEYCPPDMDPFVSREYDYWSTASTLFKVATGRTPKEVPLGPPHRDFIRLTSEFQKIEFPNETEGSALHRAALARLNASRPRRLNARAQKQFQDIVAYVSAGLRFTPSQRRHEVEALFPKFFPARPGTWERCAASLAGIAGRMFRRKL